MKENETIDLSKMPCQLVIENDAYHSSVGISSSGLKVFDKSPLHYWARYLDPDREPVKETPALEIGKLIHLAVLEPDKYFRECYPLPEKFDRRTKDGKLAYEYHEEKAAASGMTVVSAENHAICQKIVEAVHKSPAAEFLLSQDGVIENSFYWHDWQTGVLCKARPDKYLPAFATVIDIKSTTSAEKSDFERQAFNLDYHLSAAFYMRGIEAVTGEYPKSFVLIAYEKEAPFACAFYEPDDDMLAYANGKIDALLQRYAECLVKSEWPGYPEEIQKISLPGWVKTAA